MQRLIYLNQFGGPREPKKRLRKIEASLGFDRLLSEALR